MGDFRHRATQFTSSCLYTAVVLDFWSSTLRNGCDFSRPGVLEIWITSDFTSPSSSMAPVCGNCQIADRNFRQGALQADRCQRDHRDDPRGPRYLTSALDKRARDSESINEAIPESRYPPTHWLEVHLRRWTGMPYCHALTQTGNIRRLVCNRLCAGPARGKTTRTRPEVLFLDAAGGYPASDSLILTKPGRNQQVPTFTTFAVSEPGTWI